MEKTICTYDDFYITEENGKLFYYDCETTKREIYLVHSVPIISQKEEELIDGCGQPFDINGELDTELTYCYWAFA